MKDLGLLYITNNRAEAAKLYEKAAKEHKKEDKVKIICIAGKYLFRETAMPDEDNQTLLPLPLNAFAIDGKLDVIMPVSDARNPTLKARYETYSDDYKMKNTVTTIEKFIERDVNLGKEFLLMRGNELSEHNILCMWRLVIFSEHCLVQNYFPNPRKADSFLSSVFMYGRKVEGEQAHSYYETYRTMFELVKKYSVPVKSPELPGLLTNISTPESG